MSDYKSTQRKRNLTVGIFVIVAVAALVGLIFKFGDMPLIVGSFKSYHINVQFPAATGVQRDTPVRFCGYQVGRVTEVKPPKAMKDLNTGGFYHQTLVVLSIDKQYNDIPDDIEVKLMTRGLGSSYVELKLKRFDVSEPVGPYLSNGSLLQGSTGMTSEFFPEESQQKLDKLIGNLSHLIASADDIFGSEQAKEDLKATLANLAEATNQASRMIKESKAFLASVTATSDELGKSIAEVRIVINKLHEGEGSAAKFINDGRLYENLIEDTQRLETLLIEMTAFIAEMKEKGVKIKL